MKSLECGVAILSNMMTDNFVNNNYFVVSGNFLSFSWCFKNFFSFISAFQHVDSTVTALVDIIHAFAIADLSNVGLAVQQYMQMLLCEVRIVSLC